MKPLGDTKEHLQLLQEMSRATGVDLVRAQQDGLIDQSDWAEMVQACRGCNWVEECRSWLDGAGEVATPPDTCCNRMRLAVLRLEQEMECDG